MNHRQVLNSALSGLPAEKAGYFTELGAFIDETPLFEPQRHWMFLILASGLELIPPVLDKRTVAAELFAFVKKRLGSIQKAAYSQDFILKNGAPIADLATEFASIVSAAAMEAVRDGTIKSDEPDVIVYRWPYDNVDSFPYEDLDEEEEEDDEEVWRP